MTLSKVNYYMSGIGSTSTTATSMATAATHTAEPLRYGSADLTDAMLPSVDMVLGEPGALYAGAQVPQRRLSSTLLLNMFDLVDETAGELASDESGESKFASGSPLDLKVEDSELEELQQAPLSSTATNVPATGTFAPTPASTAAEVALQASLSVCVPTFEETQAMIEARAAAATAARIAEEEETRERAAQLRPTRKRKRKPRIAELDDDEKEEKRARNKLAAEKCRMKKKHEMESKTRHSIELEEENKELRQQLKGILDEVAYLRMLVAQRQQAAAESTLAGDATLTMAADMTQSLLPKTIFDLGAAAPLSTVPSIGSGDCSVPTA